ncbi:MAG: TonB-dependent receptor [Oscillibacter sp.]|nr:TonB-dependent receptor [Oscillibacter sp.]
MTASAQTQKVKGIVQDSKGESLPGVSIIVKDDPTVGTATDLDGLFELTVPTNATLKISFIGMKTQEVKVGGQKFLTVILYEDSEALEEVVVVGYGTQKKESVVGSIQTIQPSSLKVPSANLSTSFAGRMAGVIAVQRSGEPGADGANFWIRGISTFGGSTTPLIVVDGVEVSTADLNAIDPEVIESFSILKDATATALYGSRGANGVMIVTTKSGRDLDKPIINFRVETAFATPTKIPKFVSGTKYMQMYNEAVSGRRTGEVLYSDDKIAGTLEGRDPYVYPDVDWYNEMFKDLAVNEKVNFNIRGGSKRLDYFMSVSVDHETGMLKDRCKDYGFSYDNNINIWRYVFQNNLNVNVSPTTKISLKLNTQLRDYHGPKAATSDIFGIVMEANPVDFPITFPGDPSVNHVMWGGKSGGRYNSGYRNPMAFMTTNYRDDFESTVLATLSLDQKLDFLTKGLKASAMISFKNWSLTRSTREAAGYNQYQIKNYQRNAEGRYDYDLEMVGTEQATTLNYAWGVNGDRKWYIQGMINYDRTFGDVHNVSGMILYNQEEYNTNAPSTFINSLAKRKQGIAGRATYAYDNRYLLEFNFGYNGSENFAKGHRFGFFPSVALGYVISEESFWNPKVISHMKLRGSYGKVGNDQTYDADGNPVRFMYQSQIDLTSQSFSTGYDGSYSLAGPLYQRYGNKNITWETGYKTNIGVDIQLFGKVNLVLDVFKEKREGIFMKLQTVPTFLGTGNTDVYGNLGKVDNEGLDFSIDYQHSFGNGLSMQWKGTFTYAHNTVKLYNEAPYKEYPNLSRVGHSVNSLRGYVADRLFIDDAEVANSPEQLISGNVRGGDIKYIDQPNAMGEYDNQITTNDQQFMGNPSVPEIVYGFGPSFQYKGFDFSFFFQGAAKTSFFISGFHPFGTSSTRNVLKFVGDNYWSENNQNIYAKYPRLSKQDHANNTANSSFWLRNGNFLKLKNMEVGYTFKSMRIYASGTNLLTFSKFKHWDPEMGGGSGLKYPTQRVFNVGFQMTINNK